MTSHQNNGRNLNKQLVLLSTKKHDLSPPQRLLFIKKPRKIGKGGKKGKAEKAREKGKSEESLCQNSVEIWQKLSISDRTQPECRLSFS